MTNARSFAQPKRPSAGVTATAQAGGAVAPSPLPRFSIGAIAIDGPGTPGQPAASLQPPGSGPVQLKKRKRKLQGVKMSLGDFHRAVDGQLLQPGSSARGVNIPKVRNEYGHREDAVQVAMRQPWRQWNSQTETGREVRGLPLSAITSPAEFSHVTHYGALPSIRETGLDPAFANAKTGLNVRAGTSKYFKRDAYLRSSYYGSSKDVGTSMEDSDQTDEGGRVDLTARPPLSFRLRYMRTAGSVISDDSGNYDHATTRNTALSFGRLEPRHLSLTEPDDSSSVPLTSLRGSSESEYDFRRFATPPKDGELVDNQSLLDREKRLQNLRSQIASGELQPSDNNNNAALPSHVPSSSSDRVFTIPEQFQNVDSTVEDDDDPNGEWDD